MDSFNPDFILIPWVVASHPDLRPTDLKLYGVLYWLEQMSDRGCFASDKRLAKTLGCSLSAVEHGLRRLEGVGFIKRVRNDENERVAIVTTVRFVRDSSTPVGEETVHLYENDPTGVRQNNNKKQGTVDVYAHPLHFDQFWSLYPKKVGKKKTLDYWKKQELDTVADHILTGLKKHRRSIEWHKDDGQFIPHPITFLRNERWEDQLHDKDLVDEFSPHFSSRLSQ